MNMLIFLGVAAGAIVAMIVYYAVANECVQSRHEKLLTAPATYCLGAAAWLIYGGMQWYKEPASAGNDPLNGIVTIVCGVILGSVVLSRGFLKLGRVFGSIRLVLLFFLLPWAMTLLPFYPFWLFFKRFTGPVAVRIVNDK